MLPTTRHVGNLVSIQLYNTGKERIWDKRGNFFFFHFFFSFVSVRGVCVKYLDTEWCLQRVDMFGNDWSFLTGIRHRSLFSNVFFSLLLFFVYKVGKKILCGHTRVQMRAWILLDYYGLVRWSVPCDVSVLLIDFPLILAITIHDWCDLSAFRDCSLWRIANTCLTCKNFKLVFFYCKSS